MAKKEQSFLHKKSVIATFGILALLGGMFFVEPYATGNVTGNAVSLSGSFSIVPIIGIMLLVCSIVLIAYSVVHKD